VSPASSNVDSILAAIYFRESAERRRRSTEKRRSAEGGRTFHDLKLIYVNGPARGGAVTRLLARRIRSIRGGSVFVVLRRNIYGLAD